MARTKRAQTGSVGSIVVLGAIAFLIWWQWDRIEGLFGSSGAVAEVTGFQCTPQSSGRVLIEGRVRNISAAPIAFRAVALVTDTTGRRIDTVEIPIRPSPVPPSQTGEFRGDGAALPDGGSCRFDGVLDAESGMAVKHRRR